MPGKATVKERGEPVGLDVAGVSASYGRLRALDPIDVTVKPGGLVLVVGPNGAGKSTALGILSGFIPPDAGSITYRDRELVGAAPDSLVRAGIARTFQEPSPVPGLTVLENVLTGLHTQGHAGTLRAAVRSPALRKEERHLKQAALDLLASVGLADRAGADAVDLSFGELRYLEVIRCLGTGATMLLLDEPAAGMGKTETERLSALIDQVRGAGRGVPLVDHDMGFIFALCDSITVRADRRGPALAGPQPAVAARHPADLPVHRRRHPDQQRPGLRHRRHGADPRPAVGVPEVHAAGPGDARVRRRPRDRPAARHLAGCAAEFRNAHLYIQRREITEYRAALALPRRFEFLTRSCEPALPALLDERAAAGLATLADGELEVAPGVVLWPAFGTHTAGSQVVSVTTERNGRWLLAGDNVYAYENLEGLHGAAPVEQQSWKLCTIRKQNTCGRCEISI